MNRGTNMCQLETVSRLEQAAAKVLGCDVEDVREERYDSYGLKVYSYAGIEYAIGDDEEATEAANEYIKQSLWSFNASFILSHSKAGYNAEVEKALKEMQGKLCESANELVRAIIEDIDNFVEDAISADGRGTFLSSYDSNEVEVVIDGEYYYAYRLN
jgi:hypothetical protein